MTLMRYGRNSRLHYDHKLRTTYIWVVPIYEGCHSGENVFSKAPKGRKRINGGKLIKERTNPEIRRKFLTEQLISRTASLQKLWVLKRFLRRDWSSIVSPTWAKGWTGRPSMYLPILLFYYLVHHVQNTLSCFQCRKFISKAYQTALGTTTAGRRFDIIQRERNIMNFPGMFYIWINKFRTSLLYYRTQVGFRKKI